MSVPIERSALRAILDEAATIVRRASPADRLPSAKSDGSPVTAIDREVDAYLRRALTALLPEARWVSEESSDERQGPNGRWAWIVDPIDGTVELVAGRDEIAISIGLVRDGRPAAAAVANPLRRELGLWTDGTPPEFEGLAPRPEPASLAACEAIVSRTEHEAGDLAILDGLTGGRRAVGSVAYKLLRVAARADDLTYSVRPKHAWDLCGGVALLAAAGRSFLRLDGRPVAFGPADRRITSGSVAGPPRLAEAAREEILRRMGGRATGPPRASKT